MINENAKNWLATSVKLSPDELEKATDSIGWCDVCKGWEEEVSAI